ncbi:MAG: alpha/beta fold hydrolase [Isosphaeraceae bacterium]|jgi:predicted alpha/beta-fold hydrolase
MARAVSRTSASQDRIEGCVPPFEPPAWLRGSHAQTVAGRYLVNGGSRLEATAHEVKLEDSDRLCVLESVPRGWSLADPAAVLVHGLAGCACSPYIVRFARRLVRLGVRVVRMNLRGAGAGFGLARGLYHAGRSEDLRSVIDWVAHRAPGSPIALAGFSLGASLALKLAAEAADRPVNGLDCVLAANPPIDLSACAAAMRRPENRLYNWNFVHWLRAEVTRLHRVFPELGPPGLRQVRSVYEFDDRYTAPRNGFASALDYYARSSALPLIPRIELPGLVVHAADDPFVPAAPFHSARFPANLSLELVRQGGHLGYISRVPWQGDRRWLETRMAVWLAGRWRISTVHLDIASSSRDRARANMGACNRDA